MNIVKNYSLKFLNTFRINVSADSFVEVKSEKDVEELLAKNVLKDKPNLILGGGSNILFTQNFAGLVIKNSIYGIKVSDEDSENVIVRAGAGVIWNDLVEYCIEKKYGGIENLILIPGKVGAAPIQNIGAYGEEIKDVFHALTGYYLETGEKRIFEKLDCNFSYRNSVFKEELSNKFIITSVELKLNKRPEVNLSYTPVKNEIEKRNIINPSIRDISEIISVIRKTKLPDPDAFGNAGSFFKNPVISLDQFNLIKKDYPDLTGHQECDTLIKVSAGWLIEKCGWKGKRIGSVGTYPKQALVIVNFGDASGGEVLEFAMRIKEEVEIKFGIQLQDEVQIIN